MGIIFDFSGPLEDLALWWPALARGTTFLLTNILDDYFYSFFKLSSCTHDDVSPPGHQTKEIIMSSLTKNII